MVSNISKFECALNFTLDAVLKCYGHSLVLNPSRTVSNLFTEKPNPYRAVKTFHLCYRNRSVSVA